MTPQQIEREPGMPSDKALEGVKVADFCWALAGPAATRCLADFGATVIRIESRVRPDLQRTSPPFKDGKPGLDRSAFYALYNCNKYSMALNLAKPKGRDVAKRLITWADVVCENFGPGVMDKWGLGYTDVRQIKPDIVMLSSSNQGQTGPHGHHRGYATQQLALAGIGATTGWPDRLPSQIPMGFGDIAAAMVSVIAVISALDYRRRTGRGQYIDLSQLETTIHLIAPLVLDYSVNGREFTRKGNRCDCTAPHGVYPCLGDDSWCAIAVFTDEEWQNFCHCLGDPDWMREPRFATLLGRKENEEELDSLVSQWTRVQPAESVMTLLQSAGVPAGVVRNPAELLDDPQLGFRGHFWQFDGPEIGLHHVPNWGFRLSQTPVQARAPFPRLGEHTAFVCTEILGMADEEFARLVSQGVFE